MCPSHTGPTFGCPVLVRGGVVKKVTAQQGWERLCFPVLDFSGCAFHLLLTVGFENNRRGGIVLFTLLAFLLFSLLALLRGPPPRS